MQEIIANQNFLNKNSTKNTNVKNIKGNFKIILDYYNLE